jgi:hypothetical protein
VTRPRALAVVAVLAAGAAALGGCPIPQPLAEVSRVDGGSTTTAIILPETASPSATVVLVSRDCVPDPLFALSATIEDTDTADVVEARWFVDYAPVRGPSSVPQFVEGAVQPSPDPRIPLRGLAPYAFSPYAYGGTSAALHVVEVVVSNGFLPVQDPTQPLARAALPGFTTQTFRWVFQLVDASGHCS